MEGDGDVFADATENTYHISVVDDDAVTVGERGDGEEEEEEEEIKRG